MTAPTETPAQCPHCTTAFDPPIAGGITSHTEYDCGECEGPVCWSCMDRAGDCPRCTETPKRMTDADVARLLLSQASLTTEQAPPSEPGFYWRAQMHFGDNGSSGWRWAPAEVYYPCGDERAGLMTNGYSIDGVMWGPRLVAPPPPGGWPS